MNALLNQYGGLFQAGVFATVLFALAISLVCALSYPALQKFFDGVPPDRRANMLFVFAMSPLLGSFAFLLLSFAPSLLALAGLAADHCHLHPDHPHLCLLHPPMIGRASVLMLLSIAGCAVPLALMAAWAYGVWRSHRLVSRLMRLSHRDEVHGVHVVALDAPMAFAAGLRMPELFVSRQLLARLTPQQLAVVIAHERAHAVRQDALRQLLASFGAWLHLPSLRRTLLAEMAMAAEQACDERAAMHTGGDRITVAETIIKVEKLFAQWAPIGDAAVLPMPVSHFVGSNVPCRVQALLALPAGPSSHSDARPLLALALAGLIALVLPLHHMTESLLGFLVH
ncbi:M56 family metallopeptidase [Massilia glaciei]|uniref:M56 family peptidase n=1 Tax=Massilia glaciei TaxID=1524097 RepID=A0A2U2HFH7_9BURK|nr:M56 family metallopeptidase [Massilia glaciei]PWF43106.1 M56 family peptidase [Massilia glaciei]